MLGHAKCLVILLVVTLFIVRSHLLLLNITLDILLLEFVNYLLPFESLLVLGHFLRFDDMVDQLG